MYLFNGGLHVVEFWFVAAPWSARRPNLSLDLLEDLRGHLRCVDHVEDGPAQRVARGVRTSQEEVSDGQRQSGVCEHVLVGLRDLVLQMSLNVILGLSIQVDVLLVKHNLLLAVFDDVVEI